MKLYKSTEGYEYTEDEVLTAAKESNMPIEDYIAEFNMEPIGEPESGKKKPVTKKGAPVAGQKKDMASKPATTSSASKKVNLWEEKPTNLTDNVIGPKKKVNAPVKEEKPIPAKQIISTKPIEKKSEESELITVKDLQGSEEEVQKKLERKLALFGLKPEQAGIGDYITIRGADGKELSSNVDRFGNSVKTDLPMVPVGGIIFKESNGELANSAKILNQYIKAHGNKNYASESLGKYQKELRKMDAIVKSPSRSPQEKKDLYYKDLEDKFRLAENPTPAGSTGSTLTMGTSQANVNKVELTSKDFKGDLEGQYENYKRWKAGMPLIAPTENELENFIHEKNQDQKDLLASKYMSNLDPAARTALTAINVNREKSYNSIKKQEEFLAKETEFFKIEKEEFNKNPNDPIERQRLIDKGILLQDKVNDFFAYANQNKVDINSLKAQMKAGFASYDRLEQTATALKSTGIGLVYGAAELGSVALSGALAATNGMRQGSFSDQFSNNYSFLKRNVLDPIYGVKADIGKEAENFQRDLKVSEISDLEDVGRWTAGVLTQAPSSAAMALTGEFALPLFFISGVGEKRYEIEKEKYDATTRIKENTALLEKGNLSAEEEHSIQQEIYNDNSILNIPEGINISSELLSGGAEVLFEKLGTLNILKNTGNILKKLPEVTIKNTLKHVGKEFVTSVPEEGVTELLTQVTNNFGDIYLRGKKNMNVFDGTADAFAGGGIMGPGFAAIGSINPITQALQSEVRTKKERQGRQELLSKIRQLTGQMTGDNISASQIKNDPSIKAEVKGIVLQMIGEIDELDKASMNRLANTLNYENAFRVGEINARVRAINDAMAKASIEYSNGMLTEKELEGIKDHYEAEYNELDKEKETLLTEGATGKTKEKVSQTLEKAKEEFDFSVNAGYGLYNQALVAKTKLELQKKWASSDKDTKSKYYEQAQLNAGETLTTKDLKRKAMDLFIGEYFKKQIKADADATRKMMQVLNINSALTLIDDEAADPNNPDLKPKTAKEQMLDIVNKAYENEHIDNGYYKELITGIENGSINAFVNPVTSDMTVNVVNSYKNGKVSPSSHELLHNVVSGKFGDQKLANEAGENLLNYLKKYKPEYSVIVEQQMKAYENRKTGEKDKAYGEEVMNALSDAFRDKVPDKSIIREVANYLNKLTNGKFFNIDTFDSSNIESKNGKSVYEFVKSYTEGIRAKEEGRSVKIKNNKAHVITPDDESEKQPRTAATSKSLQSKLDDLRDSYELGEIDDYEYEQKSNAIEKQIASESAKIPSTQGKTIQERMDDLDDQLYSGEIDYDIYEDKMKVLVNEQKKAVAEPAKEKPKTKTEAAVDKIKKEAKQKNETVDPEAENKRVIADNKRLVASDKVQQIYDKKGLEGAQDIINLFKPITSKIVDKRRDAPGFDKELLTDEIETGSGGILDLIRSYKPSSGVPLAAYINKNLPLRAIAASRRVLGETFNKDVEEQKGLMADETADGGVVTQLPEKPKYTNILESNVFDSDVIKSITNKLKLTLRTLKSKITEPISLNKTVTPLIAEIRNEMGTQADIDIKTALGGKEGGVLKRNLLKMKKTILENMTTTWLMGKDTKNGVLGGVPPAIQKQVNGKWLSYPDWVGKTPDREKTSTDLAGRTSGADMVRRLPNAANNISNEEFLSWFLEPSGNPIRGRKESLSKALGEELSFDIILEDLASEGELYQALASNQERLGIEINETLKNDFIRQSERGNIKFSKSANKNTALFLLEEGKWNYNYEPFKKFYNLLSNKEKGDLDKWINSVSDLVAEYRRIWETNAGVRYEKDTFKQLRTQLNKILKSANIKLKEEIPDRFNSTKPDIVIIDKSTSIEYVVELKSNPYDYQGSASNGKFLDLEKPTKEFTDLEKLIKKQKNHAGRLAFINYLEGLIKQGSPEVRVVKDKEGNRSVKITEELYKKLDRSNTTVNIEVPVKALSEINPGKDILSIKNVGAFSYPGSKIAEAGIIPVLEGNVNVSTEFRTSSITKDGKSTGWRNLTERYYFTLDPKFTEKQTTEFNINTKPKEFVNALKESSAKAKGNIKFSKSVENLQKEGANIIAFHGAPKGKDFKKPSSKGVTYFATDEREANEYARMHGGETKKVAISQNGMVDEEKVINKINELGLKPKDPDWTVDEQSLYELIDPRFEGALSEEDITKLFKELSKEGVKSISYMDGAQVSGKTTTSIAVLDNSVINESNGPKFSKSISDKFNDIIAQNKKIGPAIEYSAITAKRQGKNKGKYKFFLPPGAEDFEGLLYSFLGKGKKGEEQYKFFKETLLDPYWEGISAIESTRQEIKTNFKALKDAFPEASKLITKRIPGTEFTYDQAIRVYLWNEEGKNIPGLSKTDKSMLLSTVRGYPPLMDFANGLEFVSGRSSGWSDPSEYWDNETIVSELHNLTEKVGRKDFLAKFIENADEMFSDKNLNKIEALYGTNFREALESALYRMKNGKNRSQGSGRFTTAVNNWVNGSVAEIMFLNTKSGILQLISSLNYLNMSDNNPVAAGKALLNFPQFTKDFAKIFNSDMMKERRQGLKEDVSAAEIANAAATSKNKVKAMVAYLAKIGFTPTTIADALAIAGGGASFYRNRINSYEKQGLSNAEAEKKAWMDFTELTNKSAQSNDPSLISEQQAEPIGRIILAFGNATMQMNRIMKKSARDLINGRGNKADHIRRIVFYGFIQNAIFSALQKALFIGLFGGDDDEDKDEKKKSASEKAIGLADDMLDSFLRGSGLAGAVVSTAKNTVEKYVEQREKGQKGDQAYTLLEGLNISPSIGSKARKIYSAIQEEKFNRDVIKKMGGDITLNGKFNPSPAYTVGAKATSALTNLPADRLLDKITNISEALDARNENWQRAMLMLGYKPFEIGVKNEEQEVLKTEAKKEKEDENFIKGIEKRKAKAARLKAMSPEEKSIYIDSIKATIPAKIERAKRRRKLLYSK